MKTLILVLLFIIGNGCDPATKDTPTESIDKPVGSADANNSDNTPQVEQRMNPGEITIKVKVMEVYDSGKDICDISAANVMKMSVQEVVKRGPSIVNLPNKNKEILMNFIQAPKDISTDSLIEAKARESLCRDASKTYFTIFSYKIL